MSELKRLWYNDRESISLTILAKLRRECNASTQPTYMEVNEYMIKIRKLQEEVKNNISKITEPS